MDRRVVLALVAVIAVLSAVVGWVGGQRIKSPAEIAAEQEPPTPSLITVPVELRTLSQSVVVRGTIRPSDETELEAPVVDGSTVITQLPKETGDLVTEGDVVLEVAGRPVIALQGQLPAFRNFIPSLEGPDVRQLEQALVRLDYDPGTVDDIYSPQTAAAVADLYRDAGYSPPEQDESLLSALQAAKDGVKAQESLVSQAEDALDEANVAVPDHERQRLDLIVAQAEVRLDDAKALETEIAEADAAVVTATSAASSAASRLEQAKAGTHPDTGQPPTSAELTALEAADTAASEALVTAEGTAELARAGLSEATPELNRRAAEVSLAEAIAARDERLNPPEVKALQTNLSDARSALATARSELTAAQARVGAWIPRGEVVFLSALPRQVQTVLTEVGDTPTGAVMTISGSENVIESGLSAADRRLVEVGTEALLEEDDLGLSIEAVITFVADTPGGGGLSADRYVMRLEPTGEVPEDAVNVNLRVSIPISTSGGDVMAVPLAALSAGPDGTARVEVEHSPAQTTFVEVSTGLRAEGFVEIKPLDDPLAAGDRVVVGRDLILPGGTGSGDDESDDDDSEP